MLLFFQNYLYFEIYEINFLMIFAICWLFGDKKVNIDIECIFPILILTLYIVSSKINANTY